MREARWALPKDSDTLDVQVQAPKKMIRMPNKLRKAPKTPSPPIDPEAWGPEVYALATGSYAPYQSYIATLSGQPFLPFLGM